VDVESLPPVTGTYPPDTQQDVTRLAPHEGFDLAFQDAIAKAADAWHKRGEDPVQVHADVDFAVRIDIWNPGGIGNYVVKLTPTDPG
jgi:hypothetical protein